MVTITSKDKMFMSLAAPLALLACYWFLVRPPASREAAGLAAAISAAGEPGDLAARGRLLERRLAAASAGLGELRAAERIASTNGLSGPADSAARLGRVVGLLRGQAVRVLRSEWVEIPEDDVSGPDAAIAALRKAAALDRPDCWDVELEAPYPAVVRAFAAVRAQGVPAVPFSVSMDARGGACRWSVKLWL